MVGLIHHVFLGACYFTTRLSVLSSATLRSILKGKLETNANLLIPRLICNETITACFAHNELLVLRSENTDLHIRDS